MSAQERNVAQHSHQLQMLFFKAAVYMLVVPVFPHPSCHWFADIKSKGTSLAFSVKQS